jgi:hypothetical protein
MGLELASHYETGGTKFKGKYTARKIAREAYYRISCHSQANFDHEDMGSINVAIDLLSMLDHYTKELCSHTRVECTI